jgi:lipoyl(octanoyl) transferase
VKHRQVRSSFLLKQRHTDSSPSLLSPKGLNPEKRRKRNTCSSCSAHVDYKKQVHARRKKLGKLRKRLMASSSGRSLEIWRMGVVKYAEALVLQNELVEKRRVGTICDTLLCLQHPPTFTVGKRRTLHNLLSTPAVVRSMGAEIHQTERGGDITFHGPGQAVLYPILSLRDLKLGVRKYVEGLEDTMIRLCHLYGITARGRMVKETGVWVSDNRKKIGAVGVRVSSGSITSHGLAFNIAPDLSFFQHIVPCGIADKEVTSLSKELSPSHPLQEQAVVTEQLIDCFVQQFGFEAFNCPLTVETQTQS